MTDHEIKQQLFQVTNESFDSLALEVFRWQAEHVAFYKKYLSVLNIDPNKVQTIESIPFLPIQFFKSNKIVAASPNECQQIFESSGTTGQLQSKHFVNEIGLYETSFNKGFDLFFGDISSYCILGLLPSYLERGQSSLVYMVNHLIEKSQHSSSGFYLHNHQALYDVILNLEAQKQETLLFGVTYALLDFAASFPMKLNYVKIIETGGMKGKREELTKEQVHSELKQAFQLPEIYSEYGMTELLSQAYSKSKGLFKTAPWMRLLIREMNDPLHVSKAGKGTINIIDLANLYSCSFIACDDVGVVNQQGEFSILGRLDSSDLRGCNLLVAEQ